MREHSELRFNIYIALAIAIALSVLVIVFTPSEAHAVKASNGAKAYSLSANRTYTNYDVTGDRKADKFYVYSWTSSNSSSPTLAVYINDKRVFATSGYYYYAKINLIQLKNGKCFLYLANPSDNADASVCGVFKYSGGKLKQVINCNKGFGTAAQSHTGGEVTKVYGNKMSVKFRVMSVMTAYTEGTYVYKYRNGTLKKTSKFGKLKVGYNSKNASKALKSMKAYRTTTCKSTKFLIKKGQTVHFKKVYVKGSTIRYQVKVGKKYGWIKVATKQNSPLLYWKRTPYGSFSQPPFEGLFMAG